MKNKQRLTSKEDINNLISELHELYPKLDLEDVVTIQQARDYFLQLDILVRSELFNNSLIGMSNPVIELSRKKQNKFLGDMKKHNVNVKNTFHELLVGNHFRKEGYNMIYQPKYNYEYPPDLRIEKNNKSVIIEVFTLNEYDDYNNERVFQLLFHKKMSIIEEQYNLYFDFIWSRFSINESFNDNNLVKVINSIILDIQNKLKKNKLELNSRFDTLFGLEVILSPIKLNQTTKPGGLKSPRMINRFEEKYEKYKDLANQLKMPLILICVTDCFSRLSCDPFENIINGIDQASFSPRKEGVINTNNKMPEVSEFILLDYNLLIRDTLINYEPNPNANYPFELEINKKCKRINNESIGWFL